LPPFGSRKNRPSEAPPAESASQPEPAWPSATERLNTLLVQRAELEATIAGHREERKRLLHQAEVPSLGAVTALASQSAAVQLQIEWIDRQRPAGPAPRPAAGGAFAMPLPMRPAVPRRWLLAWLAAITEFHAALHHANTVHNAALAFGDRVSNTFVRPFSQESYDRYNSAGSARPAPNAWYFATGGVVSAAMTAPCASWCRS
jgi:hypothetical protein